jgi:hypothetical protein
VLIRELSRQYESTCLAVPWKRTYIKRKDLEKVAATLLSAMEIRTSGNGQSLRMAMTKILMNGAGISQRNRQHASLSFAKKPQNPIRQQCS